MKLSFLFQFSLIHTVYGLRFSSSEVGLSLNRVGLSTIIRDRVYLASTRSRSPNNLFGSDLGIGNNGRNPPPIEQRAAHPDLNAELINWGPLATTPLSAQIMCGYWPQSSRCPRHCRVNDTQVLTTMSHPLMMHGGAKRVWCDVFAVSLLPEVVSIW